MTRILKNGLQWLRTIVWICLTKPFGRWSWINFLEQTIGKITKLKNRHRILGKGMITVMIECKINLVETVQKIMSNMNESSLLRDHKHNKHKVNLD